METCLPTSVFRKLGFRDFGMGGPGWGRVVSQGRDSSAWVSCGAVAGSVAVFGAPLLIVRGAIVHGVPVPWRERLLRWAVGRASLSLLGLAP